MTRKRLLAAAASLAALALRPRLSAQQAQEADKPEQGEDRLDAIDQRLAAIERALVDRSVADATPASRALDTRLTRLEMRLDRLERDIWNLRNRVGR
jgi:hypothetical protein